MMDLIFWEAMGLIGLMLIGVACGIVMGLYWKEIQVTKYFNMLNREIEQESNTEAKTFTIPSVSSKIDLQDVKEDEPEQEDEEEKLKRRGERRFFS